jgi:hypothetical protein
MLNIQIRPISKWPGKETPDPKWSPFRKSYRDTLKELEYELEKANAVEGSLVLEMWVDPREIRKDGQLRADARVNKQGIVFRFPVSLVNGSNARMDLFATRRKTFPILATRLPIGRTISARSFYPWSRFDVSRDTAFLSTTR